VTSEPKPSLTDYFVSFTQSDESWACWIADVLRASGKSATVGVDEIRPWERWRQSIDLAIDGARELIVLLSSSAVSSPWVRAELAWAAARGKRTYAILVDENTALPSDWAGLTVVNISGLSLPQARAHLIEAFSTQSGQLATRDVPAPVRPDVPASHFVGREAELQNLTEAFLTKNGLPATVVLTGQAGSGKTALARMFVHKHSAEFSRIRWYSSDGTGFVLSDESRSLHPTGHRELVVLDEADDYGSVAELLSSFEKAHVLVISRTPAWGRPFEVIGLSSLDRATATRLVTELLPDIDVAEAEQIATTVGGQPYLLRLASEIAKARSASGFLDDYQTLSDALRIGASEGKGYYYLDTDDPRTISEFERALEKVLSNEGQVELRDPQHGSWKRWWQRRYSSDRVDSLADRAERAAEVAALTKPEGEANLSNAEAIAKLVEATSAIPSFVILSGSVLVIKLTDDGGPTLVSKTLTATELRRLEDGDELLSSPSQALAFLQTLGSDKRLAPPG
jgi:hypothetical protein